MTYVGMFSVHGEDLKLDRQPVSGVIGYTVTHQAGSLPVVTITPYVVRVDVDDTEAEIVVHDEAASLLTRIGWTPPDHPCTHQLHAAALEQRLADLQLVNEAKDNTFGGMAHDQGRPHAPYLAGDHVTMRGDLPDSGEVGVPFIALTVVFLTLAVLIATFASHRSTAPASVPSTGAATTDSAAFSDLIRPASVPPSSRNRHGETVVRPAPHHRGTPSPAHTGRTTRQPNWHALAMCESSNRPGAVSTDGRYFGLYQFDVSTWLGHGGGRFADRADHATRGQQLLIAQALYTDRGAQPWPICGRWL